MKPLERITLVWTCVALVQACRSDSHDANAPLPLVGEVAVTPSVATVPVGGTLQLAAQVRDAAQNVLTGRAVTWASDNPALAQVSETGLVTGVSAGGPVRITATSEGRSGTSGITVAQQPASLIITPTLPDTFFSLDTVRLTAVLVDARGNRMPAGAVRWSIPIASNSASDFEFAQYGPEGLRGWSTEVTDSSVLLDLMSNGSSALQVALLGISRTATVTVRQKAVALHVYFLSGDLCGSTTPCSSSTFDRDSVTLGVNSWNEREVMVLPTDARDRPIGRNQFDPGLRISSSDSTVAGFAVALACNEADACWWARWVVSRSPGVATLWASAPTVDGTFTATAKVTVNSLP